jgi:hypothetical protein
MSIDNKTIGKIVALLVAALIFILTLQTIDDWASVGVSKGCEPFCRAVYPFFHANLLHAALNVWCLLSIVFIHDISIWRLLFSYGVAITIPNLFLYTSPTVGLSCVVFVLFGTISFEVARVLYYQIWMIVYLVLGFLFPTTNGWVHLYCYAAGFVFALLNKPIKQSNDE